MSKSMSIKNIKSTFVMNKVRGGRVPGDGMLTHERWGVLTPVDPPLFVMSTIATVTPNLRPGYDRKKIAVKS